MTDATRKGTLTTPVRTFALASGPRSRAHRVQWRDRGAYAVCRASLELRADHLMNEIEVRSLGLSACQRCAGKSAPDTFASARAGAVQEHIDRTGEYPVGCPACPLPALCDDCAHRAYLRDEAGEPGADEDERPALVEPVVPFVPARGPLEGADLSCLDAACVECDRMLYVRPVDVGSPYAELRDRNGNIVCPHTGGPHTMPAPAALAEAEAPFDEPSADDVRRLYAPGTDERHRIVIGLAVSRATVLGRRLPIVSATLPAGALDEPIGAVAERSGDPAFRAARDAECRRLCGPWPTEHADGCPYTALVLRAFARRLGPMAGASESDMLDRLAEGLRTMPADYPVTSGGYAAAVLLGTAEPLPAREPNASGIVRVDEHGSAVDDEEERTAWDGWRVLAEIDEAGMRDFAEVSPDAIVIDIPRGGMSGPG